jgi:hypothetical protein
MDAVADRRRTTRQMRLALDRFGRTTIVATAALLGMSVNAFVGLAALWCIAGNTAWAVPSFAGRSSGELGLEVTMSLQEDDWTALEAEAERQSVAVERLLHHAALCLVADLDRATTALR